MDKNCLFTNNKVRITYFKNLKYIIGIFTL